MNFKEIINLLVINGIQVSEKTFYSFICSSFCYYSKNEIDDCLLGFFDHANKFSQDYIISLLILDDNELKNKLHKDIKEDVSILENKKIRFACLVNCLNCFGNDFLENIVSISDELNLFFDDDDLPQFIKCLPTTEKEFNVIISKIKKWLGKEMKYLIMENKKY